MFLSEYDADQAYARFTADPATPNLGRAADTLVNLIDWTNSNSDGWPYWAKPSRAAARLQDALWASLYAWRGGDDPVDLTDAQLTAVLKPVKAFLTRQGVAHAEVIA